MLVLGKCFNVYSMVFVTAIAAAKGKNRCLTCTPAGCLQECALFESPVMLVIIKNVNLDFCLCHLPYNLRISRKKQPEIPAVCKPQVSLTSARRHHYHTEVIPQLTFFSFYVNKFSLPPRKHCKTRSLKQNLCLPQLPSVATETPWSIRKISELLVWKCMIFYKTLAEERAMMKGRFNLEKI